MRHGCAVIGSFPWLRTLTRNRECTPARLAGWDECESDAFAGPVRHRGAGELGPVVAAKHGGIATLGGEPSSSPSYETEADRYYLLVDAREVGTDEWTTEHCRSASSPTGDSKPRGIPEDVSVSECRCGHRGLVSRWTSAAGHAGPPEGSAQNITDRARSHLAYEEGAVTATRDTIYTGSGLRGLFADGAQPARHPIDGLPDRRTERQPGSPSCQSAVVGDCGGICPFGPDAARPPEPLLFQTGVMRCRAR